MHILASLLGPRQIHDVDPSSLKPSVYWDHQKSLQNSEAHDVLDSPSAFFKREPGNNRPDVVPAHPPVISWNAFESYDYERLVSHITFPIAPDHQLLVVIQWNVLRATMVNMNILRILDRLPAECHMLLNMRDLPPGPDTLPPALEPTAIQRAVPHDYWIDLIPCPKMRDNLILKQETYDDEEMGNDFVGGLFEGYSNNETNGFVIWGEPWDDDGWEVTEGFLKKWGYLLKGCTRLIETSNKYRAIRGEGTLVVEI